MNSPVYQQVPLMALKAAIENPQLSPEDQEKARDAVGYNENWRQKLLEI